MLRQYNFNKNWTHTHRINLDNMQQPWHWVFDMSFDDKYNHPGQFLYRRRTDGFWVLHQRGSRLLLLGDGCSADGDRPFVDELDVQTWESRRLFRSDKECDERAFGVRKDGKTLFTWRQSSKEPSNAYLLEPVGELPAGPGEATVQYSRETLTRNYDSAPVVRSIKNEMVTYDRKDGVKLSFELHSPVGYRKGTRVPTILNVYPLGYADASTAGQVSGSSNTFTSLRQVDLLLLAGYAVLSDLAFPVIGDPKKACDTYLEQLIANAEAAINKAVDMEVADRNRIGVTGHSHGRLMTANLATHTNLFRAGVATSGYYDMSDSAFGFATERRTLWQAPDVFRQVSPFYFADKIKAPLLLIHGQDDAHPNTPASASRKLYEAIRGNGGIARLVILPNEPHWYAANKSNEHEIAEMISWFDKYVKNASGETGGVSE